MSSQSGSDGYGKVRKSCQTGGASGWAKHCGSTKDHQMSNRLERKLGKQEIEDGRAPRMRGTRKRADKRPTRKHLMDKFNYIVARKKSHDESEKKHLEMHHKRGSTQCDCMLNRWFDKWHEKDMKKLLAEFEKYGYDAPTGS